MRFAHRRFGRVIEPFRSLADRFAMGALVSLCVGLLVLAKADVKLLSYASEGAADLAVPALQLLNQPVLAVRGLADKAGKLLALHEENRRLRDENRRLLAWQSEATRLGVENKALREMLRVPMVEQAPMWTAARIVGDSGGPFTQTRLIDAGSNRGIANGMAVVTENGLAGRVVQTGERSARVMLLTDFNSRIPVIVESSRDRAILQGDNGPDPRLDFLPLNPRLAAGDRVLTSGDGGLLPAGLVVGQVASVSEDGVTVAPYVDWARLDWVTILRTEPLPPPDEAKVASAQQLRGGRP
ncbi:MAG TPA: rod shape-determining protein MreC [Geminicoccaceae bacterium]|nr:rod shape-determining protein MreC [Geminicoccus sp.]HMU53117.1 rod shape-determining protein MreC [Geminicoccaceae bacterium]